MIFAKKTLVANMMLNVLISQSHVNVTVLFVFSSGLVAYRNSFVASLARRSKASEC